MRKPKVGFICIHNSCRSQIAEALGRHLAGEVFDSFSAGTSIRDQINPDAQRILLATHGIDMVSEGQWCKTLQELPRLDMVVTMGCGVRCPLLPCRWREDWALEDPTGKGDAVFLQVIGRIEERVLDLKARLSGRTPMA